MSINNELNWIISNAYSNSFSFDEILPIKNLSSDEIEILEVLEDAKQITDFSIYNYVFIQVFSYLKLSDLGRMAMVCGQFDLIQNSNSLWRLQANLLNIQYVANSSLLFKTLVRDKMFQIIASELASALKEANQRHVSVWGEDDLSPHFVDMQLALKYYSQDSDLKKQFKVPPSKPWRKDGRELVIGETFEKALNPEIKLGLKNCYIAMEGMNLGGSDWCREMYAPIMKKTFMLLEGILRK